MPHETRRSIEAGSGTAATLSEPLVKLRVKAALPPAPVARLASLSPAALAERSNGPLPAVNAEVSSV